MSGDLREQLSPAQRVERDALSKAFHDVFALASGKRVLFWMLEQCAIYQDPFTGETNSTNYQLGLQSAGRKLIGQLDEINPTFYPALLTAMAELREIDKAAATSLAEQLEPEDDAEAV